MVLKKSLQNFQFFLQFLPYKISHRGKINKNNSIVLVLGHLCEDYAPLCYEITSHKHRSHLIELYIELVTEKGLTTLWYKPRIQFIVLFALKNYKIVLMTLAGTPATTVLAGTSLVTTAPAAITALSPTVTPDRIVA